MVKGTKIDLVALGPNQDNVLANLPSAPDPNRDPNERFDPRARREERGPERGGFAGENDPWRGGSGGGSRGGGGGDRFGGGGGGDSRFGGGGGGLGRGAGFAASRGLGGGGGAGGAGGFNGGASEEAFPEMGASRAEAPSSRPPQSMASKAAAAAGGAAGTAGEDVGKWGTVFGKRSGDARGAGAMMPDSYGGSNRGGGFGGDSDPRFAGKFGSSGGGGVYGGGSQQQQPRQLGAPARGAPLPTLGPSKSEIEAEKKAKEDEKAAKKAAREEAARIVKEEKAAAAAAKDAAAQAAKDEEEAALLVAKNVYDTGLQGEALAEHISGLSSKPTCAALITHILEALSKEEVQSLKWSMTDNYGAALASLSSSTKAQLAALYSCQQYCHDNWFPKCGPKQSPLISLMFQCLYKYEVVLEGGFSAWADDDESTIPGRMNATVQTTNFMTLLFAAEEEEYDSEADEEDEDEIDAPQATC